MKKQLKCIVSNIIVSNHYFEQMKYPEIYLRIIMKIHPKSWWSGVINMVSARFSSNTNNVMGTGAIQCQRFIGKRCIVRGSKTMAWFSSDLLTCWRSFYMNRYIIFICIINYLERCQMDIRQHIRSMEEHIDKLISFIVPHFILFAISVVAQP